MKNALLLLLLLIATLSVYSQDDSRIEVNGKIIVDVEDLENITVYNTTSNIGVVTDSIGNFKLKVALNDQIRISSVQLVPFTTRITNSVIDTKVLKVYLKEFINTLDEVVLLPYDLTGNLATDVLGAKVSEPVVFNFDSYQNFEMPDDYHTRVDNIAVGTQNDRQRFQANGMAIIGVLTNLIFKKKKTNKAKELETTTPNISDVYVSSYFVENYKIPEDKVQAFIGYVENSEFDITLLEPQNELKLIAFLHAKSTAFLSLKNEDKE